MTAMVLHTDAERQIARAFLQGYYEGLYSGATITIIRVYDTTFDNGFPMCEHIVSRNCRPI